MRNTLFSRVFFARAAVLGAFVLGVLPASGVVVFAQAQKVDAAARKPAKINMAPFRAFLARSRRLKEQGKLDLSKRQALTVEVDRAEDGTLSNAVITGASAANPHFRAVAQDFVQSLSESRALQPLEGVSRVRMTFTLDGDSFTAHTASETPSAARAEEMARGYRVMLNVARMVRRGTPEAPILNNMKISASGKQLVMNLDTTREAMGNLLLKQVTPN
ncbi:MAG: hypothetical protein M3416_17385 [Acidobacteriota bacterium]|nr:hypothetical protein [Acidobacteriota bacterium]